MERNATSAVDIACQDLKEIGSSIAALSCDSITDGAIFGFGFSCCSTSSGGGY